MTTDNVTDVAVRMTIAQIQTKWSEFGAKVPAAVTKALADAKTTAVVDLDASRSDIQAAAADALIAGRDPAADKKIQAMLARRQLADQLGSGFAQSVRARLEHAVLADHSDELFASLHDAVSHLAESVYSAQQLWPDLHYDDLDSSRPEITPAQAAALAAARAAQTHLATVARAWRQLAKALGYHHLAIGNHARYPEPLLFAPLTHQQLEELRVQWWDGGPKKHVTETTVADLIRHRHPLDLATPTTIEERAAAVAEQRDGQAVSPQQRIKDDFKRSTGQQGMARTMAVRIR